MSYMLEAQSSFPPGGARANVLHFWWSVVHQFRRSYFVRHGVIYAIGCKAEA